MEQEERGSLNIINYYKRSMTIKSYLFGMTMSTILCIVSWILIVIYVNPEEVGFIGFVLFYLSLFFCLTGFFALTGFYLRKRFFKNEPEFAQIGTAFRQGIFLAIIFSGMLFLQSQDFFNLLNATLLVLGISLLEFYFTDKSKCQ